MTYETKKNSEPSIRAEVITRRTYCRPKADGEFESWDEVCDRVIGHQRWLWERARNGKALTITQEYELEHLRLLMLGRKALPSGRTLWLGGTEVSKRREASQFNCSFERASTIHDIVDGFWLLLQGVGLGFEPVVGILNGFTKPLKVTTIRSKKTDFEDKGFEENLETFETAYDAHRNLKVVWKIVVGDSAEAWAKLPGKLLANKRSCDELILDYSEIRPAGARLKSYGWISSGDEQIAKAMEAIAIILCRKAGQLLTRMDLLDVVNWLGTTLSSRRSAEIAIVPYGDPEWTEFARAKKEYYIHNQHREQSNNSLVFYHKPSNEELTDIFDTMVECGGSEPGFINGKEALRRAPWFRGINPCAEILLGDKSFCNLVETDVGKFNGDWDGLCEAIRIIARANYRQTCVDLRDGVLQDTWHELNEFLRLTGVGLTGYVRWEHQDDGSRLRVIKNIAKKAVNDMADELGLPRSKLVTTVKPSGTLGKIMDTTEGGHKPLGKYIINNVKFSIHDPIVQACVEAGYRWFNAPGDSSAVVVGFPIAWDDVEFSEVERDGEVLHVNLETAVEQLERYRFLMQHYVDHNASITVSYDPHEIPSIVSWLDDHWDSYVGVSFLLRADPTKTAEDLGHAYLPQEVITKRAYDEYVSQLKPLVLSGSSEEIIGEACSTGACPIR